MEGFNDSLLTALGTTTRGCEASSRASPTFCWFGMAATGFSQRGFCTSECSTTSMGAAAIRLHAHAFPARI
jgi:hypothetical protein